MKAADGIGSFVKQLMTQVIQRSEQLHRECIIHAGIWPTFQLFRVCTISVQASAFSSEQSIKAAAFCSLSQVPIIGSQFAQFFRSHLH